MMVMDLLSPENICFEMKDCGHLTVFGSLFLVVSLRKKASDM